MVFTIEPGLYSSEVGGFRHSDTVVVTPDGIDILTSYPKDIESLTIPVLGVYIHLIFHSPHNFPLSPPSLPPLPGREASSSRLGALRIEGLSVPQSASAS